MWRSDSAKSARSEAASSLLSPPGSANATTATSTHTPPRRRSRVSISEPSEGNNSGSGSHHASTATSAAWRARAGRQPAVTSPTTRRTFTATNAATAAGAAATSSSTRDRDRSRHKTTTPRTAAAAATRTRMTATAAAAAVRVVTGFRANVMHEYHGHLPRVGHTALLYERDVYVFGGVSDKDTYSNSLYCHEKRSLQWREVRSVGVTPSGRAHHSAVLCEHRMLIYGGHRGCDVFDDVYAYDFVSRRWDKMPAARPHAPGPVFLHAAVYVPTTQSMAVLGGFHQREYNVYLGHMYDVRNRVWCGVPPPPLHDPQQLQLVTAAYVATRDAVVVLGLVDAHTAAAAAAAAATTSSAVGGGAAATATTAAAAAAESPLSVSSPTSSLLPSTTASAVAAYKQQQQQQSSVQLPPPSVYLLNVHTLVWTRVTTTAAPESPIPFRMHDVWRVFVHDLVRMGGGYYDGWQEVWYFALDLQAVQQALLLRGDSREGSALHVRNSDVFNSNNNVRHSGASGADGGLATWLPDVFAGNNNNNNNNGSSGGVSSHSPWLHHASPPDSPRAASASSPLATATATTAAAAVLSSSSAAHTTRPQYGFFKLQLSDMTWSIVPAHLPQRLRAQLEVRAREGADRRRTPATMTVAPLPVSRRQGSGGSHNSSIDGLAMPTTIAQWRSSATAPSPLSAVSSPLPVSALSTRTTRRARLFSVHGEPPYQRKYVLTAFRESSSSSSSSGRSKRSSHGATAATMATRVPRLQYLILHGGLHPDEADYAMYMFTPTVTRLDALSAHKLVELPDSVQSIVASSSSSSHTTSGIARWLVTSKSGNSKTAMMMAGQQSSDSNSNDEDDDDDDDNAERSAASDTVLTAGASLSDATGPFARVGSPAELLSISDGSMDVVHALSTQQQQQQSQQSQHTPMRRARKQASGDGSGGAAAVHVGLVHGSGVGATRDGNNNNDNSNNSVHVGGLYSRPARQRRRSSGGFVSSPLTAHDGDGVDAARASPLLPTLLPPPRFALLHHAQNATTALTTTTAAATATTTTAATSAGAALRDRGRLSLQRQRQQQQQQQKQQQQQQQHLMPYPNCPVVVLERDADVQAWARQLYTGTRAWLARTLGDAVADDARLRRLQRRLLERTRRRVQKSSSSSTGNSGNSGSSRRVGGTSEGARRGRRGSRSSNNSNSAADSNNNNNSKDSRSAAATRRRGSGGNAQSPHASPLRGRVARTTTTSSSSQQQRGRRRSSTSSGGSARGGGGNSNKRSNSGGGDGDDDDDDDDRDGGDGSDEDDELLSSLLQTYNSSNSGGGGADDGSRLLDDELAAMAAAAGLSPLSLRRYPTRRAVPRAGGKQQHNNNNNNNNSSDEDDKDAAAATQSSVDFFARRRLHTFTLQELSRACDDDEDEAALRGDDDDDEYDDGSRGGGADGKDEREAERAGQMLTEHWLRLPGIERLRLSVTKRRGEQQRLPTSIFQRGTLAGTHVSDLGSAVAYVLLRNALAALGNDTTAAARAARARRRWAFLRALVRTGEATFLLYRARQQHARLQGVPVTSTPALLMAPELTMVGVVRAVAVPTRPVPYALPQPSLQPPRHTRMTESGMVVYSNAVTLAPLSRVSGDGGRTAAAAAATTTSAAHVYRSWS